MAKNTRLLSRESAQRLAVEAYIFLYPLVRMETVRRRMTHGPSADGPGCAPANTFAHQVELGRLDLPGIAQVGRDSLASWAWLDLSDGPVVVSCDGTRGRHFLLPMLDMWTDVFASPGTRTTGNGHGAWAVVPPGWSGYLPRVTRRIEAPTPHVWLLGQVQTLGDADRASTHQVQDALHLTPLTAWMLPSFRPTPAPATYDAGPAPRPVEEMSGREFFHLALTLLGTHPVHPTDWPMLARLERLGIRSGVTLADLSTTVVAALEAAPAAALQVLRSTEAGVTRRQNGWRTSADVTGVYGNRYLARAVTAMHTLGANLSDDVVSWTLETDVAGRGLRGSGGYVLHFEADQLPPVDAYWSLTVDDPRHRAAGTRLGPEAAGVPTSVPRNVDGSMDVYLGHQAPGGVPEGQWLSTPRGRFTAVLRMYSPRHPALDGTWAPPAARPVPAARLVAPTLSSGTTAPRFPEQVVVKEEPARRPRVSRSTYGEGVAP